MAGVSRSSSTADVVAFMYASGTLTDDTIQSIYEVWVNMDAENSSDSDLSEVEKDLLAHIGLLPNGRVNLRHLAASMIVNIRAVPAMTRVGVRRAMRASDLLLQVNNSNLKDDVATYLASVNLLGTAQAQQLLRKFDADRPFKGMFSNESQLSAVKKFYFYPQKETVYLWDRMDQRLDGDDAYIQRPVPNTYEYCRVGGLG
ncbi:NudC domain-containing protein 1 [Frankliniella fusca]|uniref:NudC domain-containing protein 1 n=1 Tax=Frankliniella fusca TaxID=407009 RepID=A0AAE1HVU7_9NEOP|nr:NudC domain-containing protein 1 [Frankliniella fusca]